jgi:hypothetical protein
VSGSTDLIAAMGAATNAVDVATILVEHNSSIGAVTFATVETSPAGRDNLGKHADLQKFVPTALRMRSDYGVPYWMGVILTATRQDAPLPQAVLEAATFHQEVRNTDMKTIHRDNVTRESIRRHATEMAPNQMLIMLSRVQMVDGTELHVPMLDFRVPSSKQNLGTVCSIIRQLGLRGVVLDSGQSYHFYGIDTISANELRRFLARCLFFTPLIDYRWVAHQLLEGACALRLIRTSPVNSIPTVEALVL